MTATDVPGPAGEEADGERPPRQPTETRAGHFPERALLEVVLKGSTSPQASVKELLGERQLWWKSCAEAVRVDPAWLAGERAEELAAWLDATAPNRAGSPVSYARQTYLLGRALSPPGGRAEDHDEDLARLREAWRWSGLLSPDALPRLGQPSGGQSGDLPLEITTRVDDVRERIARLRPHTEGGEPEPSAPGNVLVIAALLMAGAEVRKRPVVRVPVVFGQSADGPDRAAPEQGVTGVLELREFPAGPAGLYPDPRAMAGTHSPNGQFATAVGRAWRAAGPGHEGRCVLWRIVLSDDPLPPPRIEGPSLGVAFALGLRELLRHPRSRRPSGAWIRSVFYGLRPRTAVTGALGDGEHLLKISGMEAKLLTARHKGLRLVAPEANRADVAHAPEPGDVRFAATLTQADRYARQFRTGRLVIALSLVAAASLSGLTVQYQSAEAKTRLEKAHRLADVSQSLISSDVGLAELFAVQAYRQHSDPLTRQALFRAITASPHLVGTVRAGGPVSALATTSNGAVLLAGTQGGEVERWTVTATTAGRGRQVGHIPGPVTAVASDASGDVVAAIGLDTVGVWKDAAPVPAPVLPSGQEPKAVGVSPSGRFVVVTTITRTFGVPPTAWVLDRSTGATSRLDLADMFAAPDAIAFSDNSHLMLFDGDGYGTWEELTVPGPVRTRGSTMGFGTYNYASALAPDGSYLTYSNKAASLPVWASEGSPEIDKPPLRARFPEGAPAALALSRGGTRAAAALGTTLYVSRTGAPDQPPAEPVVLPGAGTVPARGLVFLGPSGRKLVSAAGDLLNMWDLDRLSRIATETTAVAETSCNACPGPHVALAPDGRTAAVLGGNGHTLDMRSLDPADAGQPSAVQPQSLDKEYGAVAWNADGSRIITVSEDGSALIFDPSSGLRETTGSWPALPNPLQLDDAPALLQFLPGGREVAQLDGSGTIRIREPDTGRVLRQTAGPRDMSPTVNGTRQAWQGQAALDRLAAHAALIKSDIASKDREIRVVDAATGSYHVIDATDFQGLAYADDQLLVQRRRGDLEVWSPDGARRLKTLKGTPGTAVGPVVGKGLIAAIPGNENTVQLLDRPSGDVLGTLPIPAGSKSTSTGLAFSADGTQLVAVTEFRRTEGDTDTVAGMGPLISWRLDPDSWISAACSSTGRELTPALWKQYLGSDAPSSLRCTP
ncbi:WD40 repeat domain-containing protein [Kitasatospora xanthocidica]|uniref:WD40 repeat domain-containing protein n=1 Tax=Kitasatospora xanthocidica TaxID=83382 RepID=UPI0036E0BAEA